jgi:ferric-dicitrate binding protein FerR (iron transport regulator)
MKMNNPKPYFNAEKAWVKLNQRLESEGLADHSLPVSAPNAFVPYLKWAASLLVVAATAATIFFFSVKNQPSELMVSNTIEGQTLVKTLNDGSVVYLASNSSIFLTNDFGKSNRSIRLEGEAFFEVNFNEKLPFIIEIETASVEVLGTSFVLKNITGQDVELIVETGKVGFSPLNYKEKSVVVEKGERLVFDGYDFKKSLGSVNSKRHNNHLHFSNEQLVSILSVINKNYGVNVLIDDNALAKRQLTVTFQNNTVEEMVSIICEYYNLRSNNIDEDTILLTKK